MIGVTRQTVANWESGQSVPDVLTMKKLADRFNITVDELLCFHEKTEEMMPGIKERYLFDKVTVGAGSKIKLSREVCEAMDIKPGDELLVLGDIERGIELLPPNFYWEKLLKK